MPALYSAISDLIFWKRSLFLVLRLQGVLLREANEFHPGRLEFLHLIEVLVDLGDAAREPDGAGAKLHLAELQMRGQRAIGNGLTARGNIVGLADLGFRHELVGDHAGCHHDAECAGNAELVANAVELDHAAGPSNPAMRIVASVPSREPIGLPLPKSG
jgi:hypothetical protein